MFFTLAKNSKKGAQITQLSTLNLNQGAHYESTYNVNYKGEVGTRYLGFREKNNFYCPGSDKGSENCH